MTIHDHYKLKSLAYKATSALLYDHGNGMDFTQKKLATELQKSLHYQTHGLKKTINKELEKMTKTFDIQALSQELLESLPYEGDVVLYNDGSLSYLSQGSMSQAEFNGEVKRIGYINLSRDYWHDVMLEYDCDYDTITDDLREDLLVHFNDTITDTVTQHLSDDY